MVQLPIEKSLPSRSLTSISIGPKVQPMRVRRLPPTRLFQGIVCVAYLSLTVWMHIWALEAGFPQPNEPAAPHHQVCTWIGTSGEAGLAGGGLTLTPRSTVSLCHTPSPSVLVLPVTSSSISARAPPFFS